MTEHEEFVLNEFKLTEDKYPPISNKYYLPTYEHFDYLFKITNNPDYNSCLGKHTAQKTINQVREDFKNFFAAMKKYKADKTNFTGIPNLPNYARVEEVTITSSNQECYIFEDNGKWYLKLPKTKIKLEISEYNVGKLVHIKIKPFYDTYKISIITEKEIQSLNLNPARILGIDLGVDNFATISNNVGLVPFIINGKELKSYNQYYNKQMAEYKSRLPKNQWTSKRLKCICKNRTNYIKDKMHKFSTYIIDYCVNNNIGTIVIGKNNGWQDSINLGKVTNQNFCSIPYNDFIKLLISKAELKGITVLEREESYTSKASFLDKDDIPTYNPDNKTKYKFSGRRVHRGLYKSKNGIFINADINGASNTIRKEFPNAFDNCSDLSYLYKTVLIITL